jgi:hypothetical protein
MACDLEMPNHLDLAGASLRFCGCLAGEDRSSGGLGIVHVGLAVPTTGASVGAVDHQDMMPCLAQGTGQTSPHPTRFLRYRRPSRCASASAIRPFGPLWSVRLRQAHPSALHHALSVGDSERATRTAIGNVRCPETLLRGHSGGSSHAFTTGRHIPHLVRSRPYRGRCHCDCRGHFQPNTEVSCLSDVRCGAVIGRARIVRTLFDLH